MCLSGLQSAMSTRPPPPPRYLPAAPRVHALEQPQTTPGPPQRMPMPPPLPRKRALTCQQRKRGGPTSGPDLQETRDNPEKQARDGTGNPLKPQVARPCTRRFRVARQAKKRVLAGPGSALGVGVRHRQRRHVDDAAHRGRRASGCAPAWPRRAAPARSRCRRRRPSSAGCRRCWRRRCSGNTSRLASPASVLLRHQLAARPTASSADVAVHLAVDLQPGRALAQQRQRAPHLARAGDFAGCRSSSATAARPWAARRSAASPRPPSR